MATDKGTGGKIETAELAKAQIGTTPYTTLAAAFAAAQNGETINLLVSVKLDQNPYNVELGTKSVTLDLGGNTLFGRTNLKSGSLTVQNGAIVCEDGQPLNVYGKETIAQNYSVLNIANNVTVSGKYGVCMFGEEAKANGYGAVANIAGKINAENPVFVHGILGNNIAEDMNNVVNINSGAVLTSTTDVAVALNGWATVNVKSGATINGSTGIAVKRGVLNVEEGATVTANGEWTTPPAANNNGTEPTGAAVSMTPTYSQYGAMAVNITGGTFSATGTNSEALYKSNGTYQSDATFTVTGGTFSSDPTAFVAPGYVANENTDGTWTVEPAPAVAKIGDVTYTTLADAFTAAQDNQTIVVIRNIDLPATIQVDKTVTLNLDGKTIFNTEDIWVGNNWSFFHVIENGNLTVTGNGTMDAKEDDCYTFDVDAGGVLNIVNGTFKGNISCVYLYKSPDKTGDAICNIAGGTFSIKQLAPNVDTDKYRYLLNCRDAFYISGNAIFNVTGGSFVHFNPANNLAEGPNTSFVPGGYYATEENDTWTVLEETNVAQIGETKYATLAAAFAAAQEVGTATIKILKDFAISDETFTIANDKSIVLDLNGMTVTATGGTKSVGFTLFDVKEDGTFEVTDNSANKDGKVSYSCADPDPSYGKGYYTICSEGTVIVSAGTVENATIGGAAYAIDSHANAWGANDNHDCVLTITGGNILCPDGDQSIRAYQNGFAVNNPYSYNTVNISGGYIDKGIFIDTTIQTESTSADFDGSKVKVEVNITGGTINGLIDLKVRHPFNTITNITGGNLTNCKLRVRNPGDNHAQHVYGTYGEPTQPMVSISGNANVAFGTENFVTSGWTTYNNQFTITGGTFNVDPSAYVATGYKATKSGNVWTVEAMGNWVDYAASDDEFAAATNGTEISISSAALLAKFAKNVNEGVSTYNGYTIKLTADIDLAGKNWTPVGVNEENGDGAHRKTFEGTFEGNNKTISNLYCYSTEDKPLGLFGFSYAGPSYIQNLTLSNVFVYGVHQVGAIIGNSINVHIDNCKVSGGRVTSTPRLTSNGYDDGNQAGGIAGQVFSVDWHASGLVSNCTVEDLTIKAYRDVGGIAGCCQYGDSGNSPVSITGNTVKNCTVIADQTSDYVETKPFNANGIVGRYISGTVESNTATNVTVQEIPHQ